MVKITLKTFIVGTIAKESLVLIIKFLFVVKEHAKYC